MLETDSHLAGLDFGSQKRVGAAAAAAAADVDAPVTIARQMLNEKTHLLLLNTVYWT
jgi:isoaspartyl peptidase/L-asparaginase-like protein (Ntn-hydrolase superfamily)